MLSKELIDTILSSTWCTLPATWEYTLRSNSYLKLLDLSFPDTYGIHVAYHLLTGYVNYVLIVLPIDYETDHLIYSTDVFNVTLYEENNSKHLVFYRKEFEK